MSEALRYRLPIFTHHSYHIGLLYRTVYCRYGTQTLRCPTGPGGCCSEDGIVRKIANSECPLLVHVAHEPVILCSAYPNQHRLQHHLAPASAKPNSQVNFFERLHYCRCRRCHTRASSTRNFSVCKMRKTQRSKTSDSTRKVCCFGLVGVSWGFVLRQGTPGARTETRPRRRDFTWSAPTMAALRV